MCGDDSLSRVEVSGGVIESNGFVFETSFRYTFVPVQLRHSPIYGYRSSLPSIGQ